ncbi:MAG: PKD domain-containing protein [Saprospiraceae bacterium]
MQIRFFGIVLALLFSYQLSASHIIGGEVTYECLGNGQYLVEFHLYRDCSGNVGFDNLGILTYFICDANGTCADNKTQADGNVLRVAPREIRPVSPPDLECLLAPVDACVEEAIYAFEIDGTRAIFNPMSDSSYVIAFQRCCRNETILNIEDPEFSGSTYVIEINPASQASCNSSPVFNNFPPTVICNNEPINFDHSASDPDGDSLVYFFCSPLLGGGIVGDVNLDPTGDARDCDGVSPEPACTNLEEVVFIGPTYSAATPMAGNPVVSIDSVTGLITGIPTIQGQFVVGVCVEEYRDGQLMGSIQRDFQFNVAACIQNITAQIQSDEVRENIGPNGNVISRDFALTFCGQETVTFVNESFDRAFINDILWEFEEGTIISNNWDAEVMFPGQGDYAGKLYLNPNSPQCIDSANIFVKILPDITADFSQSFDSCTIGPVTFVDASSTDAQSITNWDWDLGDGNTSNLQNPVYQYANAGNYGISLSVTDNNGCTDTETVNINYAPAPQSVAIVQSTEGGCNPTPIVFTNNSMPIGADYEILWDFGDGNTSTEISPTHVYETAGVYSVSLSIESPLGCFVAADYPDLINILESPEAGFSLMPNELSSTNPTVQVNDASFNAVEWRYEFSNQGTSTMANPSFTFRDTGQQQIVQIVTAPSGCRDTAVQLIDVIPFVQWFMPNAFTPTRDGVNDIFIGNGALAGATDFTFTIWNRWGELVFETDDFTQGWNGRKGNAGRDSPTGVYVYLLSYRTPRGEKVQLDGFATLIR